MAVVATGTNESDPPPEACATGHAGPSSISDARYRAIVEDQTDLVCRFQPDTTLTFVNSAYCRYFGRTPEELVGRRFLDLIPEEVRPAVLGQLAGITRAQPVASQEHAVVRSDGSLGWQHWINRAFFSESGEIVEFQAVGRDVTERHQAEAELRLYRTRLEELVQQRTAELARINARLQQELADRQRAEQNLRESEERFRQLAENIHEVFWLSGPDSRQILYISPAVEQLWGQAPAEVYSDTRAWLDAVHPDDRPAVAAMLQEQSCGLVTDCEFRLVRPDGELRWVRNRGFPVRNAAGEVYRIAGIAEDVTERRRAEEAVRAARDYLDSIINCIADPIFVKDRQHRLVLVNDAECALSGRSREEMLGRTDYDFFPKAQVDVFWEKDEAVFETGQENTNEEEITDAAGRTRTIVTRKTLYTDPGGHKFIVGIIRDITERKAVENELLRIRKAVDSSSDAVGIADLTVRHVYQNQALYDLLGYTVDELNALGGPPAVFSNADLAQGVFATVRAGHSWQGEVDMRTARGSVVPVFLRADAIKDAQGHNVAFVGIMTNIAERKSAEAAARRHQEEIAHAARLSAVGEMASGLAHELAQPLSAILYLARGCITQLEHGRWGTADAQAAVAKIAAQAERAGQFIRHLKAFVRKAQPRRELYDLNAIVRDALALLLPQARSARVTVQLDLDETLGAVRVDPIQVEQVVLNLVRNSVEALALVAAGERRLHIRTYMDPQGRACCEVRDTGPGLAEGAAERIFDPFFTTKPHGTGLGLAISRRLIEEMHDGQLWVRPHPEQGVLAGFSLPAGAEVGDAGR
jgi:PAS domain S-box-containing protein